MVTCAFKVVDSIFAVQLALPKRGRLIRILHVGRPS
jgi:hypothetical protein